MRSDLLFSTGQVHDLLATSLAKMKEAIERYDANKLLNSNVDDLVAYFTAMARVDPIDLREDEITVDQHETQIQVPNQFAFSHGPKEYTVDGVGFSYHVPFTGEAALFRLRPSTYNYSPPSGVIRGNELILTRYIRSGAAENPKPALDQELASVRQYVGWSRGSVEPHNSSLAGLARGQVEERRKRLLQNQNLVASFGYPLRSRPEAPKTYAVPDVRLRPLPPPPASSAPFVPEPILDDAMYARILEILTNMVGVMERSPEAFESLGEESLRTHFLMQLNGAFEGRAGAETFRGSGSTDILLEDRERGVFLAECKIWKGPESLNEALDQILDYSLWRDGKAAVLMFNRNVDFTSVLEAARDTISSHPQTTGDVNKLGETVFRSKLRQRDDPSRVITVTTMVFNVPTKRSVSKRVTSRRRTKKPAV